MLPRLQAKGDLLIKIHFYQSKTTPKTETLAIWQVIKGWVTCGLWLGNIARRS